MTDDNEVYAGPECLGCGCRHLPVYKSVKRNKQIIRYRRCRNCHRNMVTREKIIKKE